MDTGGDWISGRDIRSEKKGRGILGFKRALDIGRETTRKRRPLSQERKPKRYERRPHNQEWIPLSLERRASSTRTQNSEKRHHRQWSDRCQELK